MIAAIVLAAQYTGTLDVSDTTRLDGRNTNPPPVVTTVGGTTGTDYLAADAATTGYARLFLTDRFWEYTLIYSPSVTVPGIEIGFEPLFLNTGSASVSWHDRFIRATVSEGATYGILNSAFLYAPPNAATAAPGGAGATGSDAPTTPSGPPTTVTQGAGSTAVVASPKPGNIAYGASTTAATISALTGRRGVLSLSGAYSVSGGLTTDAKKDLPEQYGPVASASFGYTLSRIDTLSTVLAGGETYTSGPCIPPPGVPLPDVLVFCAVHTPYASAQESLRHAFSGASSLTVNLGASAAVSRTPYIHEAVVDPIILATFTQAFSPSRHNIAALTASAGFVPTVDVRTGLPSNRAQATLSYSELVASRTTLTVTGSAVQSVPIPVADPYPLTSLGGTIDVTTHVDRFVDVGVGIQSLWQKQSGYGILDSNIGYVNVVGRLPTARF